MHNKSLSGSDSVAHKQLCSAIPCNQVGFVEQSGGTNTEDTSEGSLIFHNRAGGYVKEH